MVPFGAVVPIRRISSTSDSARVSFPPNSTLPSPGSLRTTMARTRTLFSSALLGLLLAAAAPAAVHAEESTSTTPTHSATAAACATGIHVIVARGSSEKPGVGRMGVVAGNVTERVPGSTVEAVTYPATFDDYIDSEGEGVVAMTDMVVEYVKSCPDARIALLGYSQVSAGGGGGDWRNGGWVRFRRGPSTFCLLPV